MTARIPSFILITVALFAVNFGIGKTALAALPPAPIFSPSTLAVRDYSIPLMVSIRALPRAHVFYTLDGSPPVCFLSIPYGNIFYLNNVGTTTIKAVNCVGLQSSEVTTATYTTVPPPKPLISPVPGNYIVNQTINLRSVPRSRVYYTIDGSNPVCGSSLIFTYPFTLREVGAKTVKAVTCVNNIASSIASSDYNITPPPPPISSHYLESYSIPQIIFLRAIPRARISYTLDGSNPTCSSGLPYAGYIKIEEIGNKTIKAVACLNSIASEVATFNYEFAPPLPPTFSPPAVRDYFTPLNVLINGAPRARAVFTLDGSNPTCISGTAYAGLIRLSMSGIWNVKAVSCVNNIPSSVASVTYTVR